MRPIWGTYRVGHPQNDFGVATEIYKTCAKCGLKQPTKDYLLIGETEGSGDYAPVRWLIPSEAPPIPKKSTADLLVGLFKQNAPLIVFSRSRNEQGFSQDRYLNVKRLTCAY
jgi:hypothetical protein